MTPQEAVEKIRTALSLLCQCERCNEARAALEVLEKELAVARGEIVFPSTSGMITIATKAER